ncbi:MAG: twin-arginine translocase TatA/TatE family subunit [Succinivibrio sp.]
MNFLGLDEILIIVLVSLIILGPVKTFGIAVYFGRLFGKAKTYLKKIASELDLEETGKAARQIKTGFKDALKDPLVSKVAAPVSGKRMWTVDTDSSMNNGTATSSVSSVSDSAITDDLIKRISALEEEVERLKKQAM